MFKEPSLNEVTQLLIIFFNPFSPIVTLFCSMAHILPPQNTWPLPFPKTKRQLRIEFFFFRTKILQQEDARERERLVVKFIKIMKWLRKYNNFNSYLALLSALDSAPIRRLEWQKSITEGLKEYCALIDSSSSFRAYRLALAESK